MAGHGIRAGCQLFQRDAIERRLRGLRTPDVNAQTRDGRLTVNENAAGTLTVFKYPNPSYYKQIK